MRIFFTLFLFFPIIVHGNIFINFQDIDLEYKLKKLNKACSTNIFLRDSFPQEISLILTKALSIKDSESSYCLDEKKSLISYIKKKYIDKNYFIEFQSKLNTKYLQTNIDRITEDERLTLNFSNFNENLVLNFNLSFFDGYNRLDGSEISYFGNNKVIKLSKKNIWWSPSENFSLILSNQARPFKHLYYSQSLNSSNSKSSIIKKLGNFDYEFFIGKINLNSDIKNSKILGLRFNFYTSNNFNWSLFRTAQFGGDGRDESASAILNLLIGRENAGSDGIDAFNDPGNQLAGIDFVYRFPSSNVEVFGQIVGEDEAGYLPSRLIYNIGFNKFYENFEITFEHLDTFSSSNIKNYTYEHYIFRDGYRHRMKPFGASIDADSNSSLLSIKHKLKDKHFLKLSLSNSLINQHNNSNNSISSEKVELNNIRLSYQMKTNNFSEFNFVLDINDSDSSNLNKNNFIIIYRKSF